MIYRRRITWAFIAVALLGVSACGNGGSGLGSGSIGSGSIGSGGGSSQSEAPAQKAEEQKRSTIWDLFDNKDDPNTTVEVNKYLWNASLDVLNFLPIQAADPFSGVIVTGFGTPPGGGQAYRATIYVQDPALDARSLTISLQTRSGPASPDTVRAVEDAILTRARQLRIRDGKL